MSSFDSIIHELKEQNKTALLYLILKSINDSKYQQLQREVINELANDKSLVHFQKQHEQQIRVLIACHWSDSTGIIHLWNKMSENNNFTWKNILIVDKEPADFYCIINRPVNDDFKYDPKKTIIFRMEPYMEKRFDLWGPTFTNPDSSLYKFVGKHEFHHNNVEWHLKKTYQELMNEPVIKNNDYNNVLSTILSNKYKDPGHIKRVDFIKFIEQKMDVHVYGSNHFLYKNYKGQLPSHEKDDSLFPYKYGFNVENHSIKNYFTEKIVDGILSETLMFYSGCFNLKDFIDERAFVYLELSNFENDFAIIKKAMEEDWYTQRLPYIKEAKQKILNELQFFPRLHKIINQDIKT